MINPQQFKLVPQILSQIQGEGEYSQSIITMMLSAISNKKISTDNFQTLSVTQCIQKALEHYPNTSEGEKEIIHFDDKNEFQFWGDEKILMNILYNFIKNSLHFINKARKGEIYISLEQSEHNNFLRFKDTGPGIAADILPSIFNDFFTKRKGGTGIGLYFVKRTMESFNGKVSCQSVEGEYTEFLLTFPVIEDLPA